MRLPALISVLVEDDNDSSLVLEPLTRIRILIARSQYQVERLDHNHISPIYHLKCKKKKNYIKTMSDEIAQSDVVNPFKEEKPQSSVLLRQILYKITNRGYIYAQRFTQYLNKVIVRRI